MHVLFIVNYYLCMEINSSLWWVNAFSLSTLIIKIFIKAKLKKIYNFTEIFLYKFEQIFHAEKVDIYYLNIYVFRLKSDKDFVYCMKYNSQRNHHFKNHGDMTISCQNINKKNINMFKMDIQTWFVYQSCWSFCIQPICLRNYQAKFKIYKTILTCLY